MSLIGFEQIMEQSSLCDSLQQLLADWLPPPGGAWRGYAGVHRGYGPAALETGHNPHCLVSALHCTALHCTALCSGLVMVLVTNSPTVVNDIRTSA